MCECVYVNGNWINGSKDEWIIHDELIPSDRPATTFTSSPPLHYSYAGLSVARGKEVHLTGLSFTETICGLPQGRGNYGHALNY